MRETIANIVDDMRTERRRYDYYVLVALVMMLVMAQVVLWSRMETRGSQRDINRAIALRLRVPTVE